MSKSVIDSTLISAVFGALLYFAGLTYYVAFFLNAAVSVPEFLPPAPLVVAMSGRLLFWGVVNHSTFFGAVIGTALLLRILRKCNKNVCSLFTRLQRVIEVVRGWPSFMFFLTVYVLFVAYAATRGYSLMMDVRFRGLVELPWVSVHLKTTTGAETPKSINGYLLAESPTSYAVADDSHRGYTVVVRKENVIQVDSINQRPF